MASIILIDDDYASALIADNLRQRGHTVRRVPTVDEALADVPQITSAELVILDLIMPRSPEASLTSPDGNRCSGMLVYRAIRDARPELPILVLTANQDPVPLAIIHDDPYACHISRWGISFHDLIAKIQAMLGLPTPAPAPRAFIVHGHDDGTKLELKNYLQNTLGLPEPVILHERANVGRTLIEKFEEQVTTTDIVFVLLTPDDPPADPRGADHRKRRARQNVILELGIFMGVFGRRSGRIFLLYKGELELPSDLAGVVYMDISKGIASASDSIRRELAALGYTLSTGPSQ